MQEQDTATSMSLTDRKAAAEARLRRDLREYFNTLPTAIYITDERIEILVGMAMCVYHQGAIDALDLVQERQAVTR